MNVFQLTPGTGHFFCGSCLRDDALTLGLRQRGHTVTAVPLYLPMVLERDDPGQEAAPVLMGGINLYLGHRSSLFRRLPREWTGFLDRPGLLRWSARHGEMTDASRLGALTLSMLKSEDGPIAREIDLLAERLTRQLADSPEGKPDAVILSNGMLFGLAARLKQALDAPVVCTLQGEPPFLDALPEPYREQAWAILREKSADVDAFMPVSQFHGEQMQRRLGLPEEKIHVVWNGIDIDGLEPAPDGPDRPTVGFLARMCREKGLPALVEAFILLRTSEGCGDAILRVAGVQLDEDRPLVEELRRRLHGEGFGEAVEFLPNLDRADKIRFLRSLSVLSVPSECDEAFGLFLLEALACGVPVVQPRRGAFPEVVEATGGGMLCDPDDPAALADALAGLLRSDESRRRLGERGRRAVVEQFSAVRMAERVEDVLHAL